MNMLSGLQLQKAFVQKSLLINVDGLFDPRQTFVRGNNTV